jgi:release factor glutamine methyltransferase
VTVVPFGGLELVAEPGRVMVPRPASLGLVERALTHIGDRPAVVVDVGTGSGAVALAIAEAAPRAVVWATDIRAEAVALARRNALRLGLGERVRVRRGDLLEPVPGRVDVIVANLPYLPRRERPLHPDLAGEPDDAVFAAGDGLGLYRRLIAEAPLHLVPGGLVAFQLRGKVVTPLAASAAISSAA